MVTNKEVESIAKKLGYKGDLGQLKMGISSEFEHKDIIGTSKIKSAKIALAHLREHPKYYTFHAKMEAAMENDLEKKKKK